MPYAPGNQNNAAEYISQAGNDVAAGIRQFQQNDLMRSTDISKFYSTAQTDPALVQFLSDPTKAPPGVSKIYQKLNSTGHLSVAEAAQLGSFTDLYTKNKVEQQTSAARDASTKLATAQAGNYNALAAQASAKAEQDKADHELLKQLYNNPDGGAPSAPSQSPAAPAAQADPADAIWAPTAPAPTRTQVAKDLARSTGALPSASDVNSAFNAAADKYGSVTIPVGWIAVGTGLNKDGQDVVRYQQLSKKNDGIKLRSTDTVEILKGNPPPGLVLDGTTYRPLPAPAAAAVTGADGKTPPPPVNLTTKATADLNAAQTNVEKITRGLDIIRQMREQDTVMQSKRSAGSSGITGTDTYNYIIGPRLFDDSSGQMFDSLGSQFKGDVMSGLKNIRNVFEFKAVTGNIPTSRMTPVNRKAQMDNLEEKLNSDLSKTRQAIDLITKGTDPDQAWGVSSHSASTEKIDAPSLAASASVGNDPASLAKAEMERRKTAKKPQ